MNIENIIEWIVSMILGAIGIVVFAFKNFATKENLERVDLRLNHVENKMEKTEEKIERKLELISDKLDKVLFNYKQ